MTKEQPAHDGRVELQLATLEQIADEMEKRYGTVILGVHRVDPGTAMCKRGDMTTCLGVHQELGWFLKYHYDQVPLGDLGEDR